MTSYVMSDKNSLSVELTRPVDELVVARINRLVLSTGNL
jgi:hypothetical protein